MKSPFAGMDPYIEACGLWEDFHFVLVTSIRAHLVPRLPDRYTARVGERAYIALVEPNGKNSDPFVPDFALSTPTKKPTRTGRGARKTSTAVIEEPVLMRPAVEEQFREIFLEIYDACPERRLVTTIEVISPSNKPGGSGHELYLRKRQAHFLERRNLVEIDLLRLGPKMPMIDPWPDSPYSVLVYHGADSLRCRVWPAFHDRTLPTVPIPLLKGDADVMLEIQPLVDAVYRDSRYAQDIDYTVPLKPPLG